MGETGGPGEKRGKAWVKKSECPFPRKNRLLQKKTGEPKAKNVLTEKNHHLVMKKKNDYPERGKGPSARKEKKKLQREKVSCREKKKGNPPEPKSIGNGNDREGGPEQKKKGKNFCRKKWHLNQEKNGAAR